MTVDANPGAAVAGGPRALLRVEGLLVLLAGLGAYWYLAGGTIGWWGFLLFFLPDLSIFAYLAGPRAGAFLYNAAHTYLTPAALALAAGLYSGITLHDIADWTTALAALWAAHIGFDRALGYGLKYRTAFADTHLGRIGRAS